MEYENHRSFADVNKSASQSSLANISCRSLVVAIFPLYRDASDGKMKSITSATFRTLLRVFELPSFASRWRDKRVTSLRVSQGLPTLGLGSVPLITL